jgi:putative solute:sodium symporter small subunit
VSDSHRAYWRANLRLLCILLVVWFAVSFGAGILFVEALNTIHIGGFPLGFWFSQQGSILVFVVLVFVYARAMDRLERKLNEDVKDS